MRFSFLASLLRLFHLPLFRFPSSELLLAFHPSAQRNLAFLDISSALEDDLQCHRRAERSRSADQTSPFPSAVMKLQVFFQGARVCANLRSASAATCSQKPEHAG